MTTLRQDVETYGRHAKVAFGRDWEGDAHRRDFTINALSVTADGTVHDYTGGLADLAARRVRFIGDARTRIEEDYLRILRFFRFHAAYGHGDPDRAGLHACIEGRAGLDQLSRERVRMEMMKLLVAARLVVARGEEERRVTLKAEDLDFSGVKLPAPEAGPARERLEASLEALERLEADLDLCLKTFLALRTSPAWADEVTRIRAWVAGPSEDERSAPAATASADAPA